MHETAPTARTQVRRMPERGHYDRETVHAILDATFLCHAGFVVDGQPFVIPTAFGRAGNTLYLHGSAASRMLRDVSTGIPLCVTVTLLDALVLARSAFHHSMNYRSVVVLGKAAKVEDETAKLEALRVLSEHIIPGRWDTVRQPTLKEMKATTVLSLPIEEASAKMRSGPPGDDDEDYALDIWAGLLPMSVVPGAPISDPALKTGIAIPDHVTHYKRR